MGNEHLPYENLAELVLQVHKAINKIEAECDVRDELYDCFSTSELVAFFIGLGQADSSRTYAEFGKVSKELAERTLSRFANTHKLIIQHVLETAKEYEA